MKYGVLVTSAANAKFSVYSPEQRVEQTLVTIDSVRKYIPNSTVILTDCGIPSIEGDLKNKLINSVDKFIDLSKDANVNWIANNITHQDTVKNLTELVVVGKFFKLVRDKKLFDDCDRIFKVSGRYFLNEKFDITRYEQDDAKGKYVVSKKMMSQFPLEYVGQSLQYMLRVYSFDRVLLDDFIERVSIMTKHMQEQCNAGKYIDIEHLFCKFLPKELILEIARTGVAGNVAPNGTFIEN